MEVQIPDEDEIQLVLTVMVASAVPSSPALTSSDHAPDTTHGDLQFEMEAGAAAAAQQKAEVSAEKPPATTATTTTTAAAAARAAAVAEQGGDCYVSSTTSIPGARLEKYKGRVSLHFIKESFSAGAQGGVGGFTYVFMNEINAIARAHVQALGGNALLGYKFEEMVIMENDGKNQVRCATLLHLLFLPASIHMFVCPQAYALISISGDAFVVSMT